MIFHTSIVLKVIRFSTSAPFFLLLFPLVVAATFQAKAVTAPTALATPKCSTTTAQTTATAPTITATAKATALACVSRFVIAELRVNIFWISICDFEMESISFIDIFSINPRSFNRDKYSPIFPCSIAEQIFLSANARIILVNFESTTICLLLNPFSSIYWLGLFMNSSAISGWLTISVANLCRKKMYSVSFSDILIWTGIAIELLLSIFPAIWRFISSAGKSI